MTDEGILPLRRPFAEAQGFGSGLRLRTSAQGQNGRKRKLRITKIGMANKKGGVKPRLRTNTVRFFNS